MPHSQNINIKQNICESGFGDSCAAALGRGRAPADAHRAHPWWEPWSGRAQSAMPVLIFLIECTVLYAGSFGRTPAPHRPRGATAPVRVAFQQATVTAPDGRYPLVAPPQAGPAGACTGRGPRP